MNKTDAKEFFCLAMPNIWFLAAVTVCGFTWDDVGGEIGGVLADVLLPYGMSAASVLYLSTVLAVVVLCGPMWACLLYLLPVGVAVCLWRIQTAGGSAPIDWVGALLGVSAFWAYMCAHRMGNRQVGAARVLGWGVRITVNREGKTRVDEEPVCDGDLSVFRGSWLRIGRMFLLMVAGVALFCRRAYKRRHES